MIVLIDWLSSIISILLVSLSFILILSFFFSSSVPCLTLTSLCWSLPFHCPAHHFFLITLFTSLNCCCYCHSCYSFTLYIYTILIHSVLYFTHNISTGCVTRFGCFDHVFVIVYAVQLIHLFSFTSSLCFIRLVSNCCCGSAGSCAIELVHNVNYNGEILHEPYYLNSDKA